MLGTAALACARSSASPGSRGPVTTRAHLRAVTDSVVADQRNRGGSWSILVVDPAGGDTIYSLNAGKLRVPASNQKIVTAAVALRELGPDFRFATRFAHTGDVRDSVIRGNLVVFGPAIRRSARASAETR
jgi:D-alanyl-D-alanine carboxypeptidase/D-alanyl-D-alanine-endopeptidase (penicillin-binding protein 4)